MQNLVHVYVFIYIFFLEFRLCILGIPENWQQRRKKIELRVAEMNIQIIHRGWINNLHGNKI